MRATWKGAVIAESEDTVVVEGNPYFPSDSVNFDYLTSTDTTTRCPWKGTASYYTITVDGQTNPDAAWVYVEPLEAAREIAGHLAFWRGVEIS